MSRAVEQTLLSLLPTQTSAVLPPQLVDLAGSLLAQSRNRASTLKAEEEVARTYACAHLACDRLKIPLNLPPIDPRPPIPPRIYKRLYTHLDKILPGTAVRSASARAAAATTKTTTGGNSSSSTPRPRDALAATRRAGAAVAGRDKEQQRPRAPQRGAPPRPRPPATTATPYPAWVRPVARFVCAELGAPRLVAFVIAGVDAIVREGGAAGRGEGGDEWADPVRGGNLAPLLAAVAFYVLRAAEEAGGGGGVAVAGERGTPGARAGLTSAEYKVLERRFVDVMRRARAEVAVVNGTGGAAERGEEGEGEGEGGLWEGWRTLRPRLMQKALMVVNGRGWLESDWFAAVRDVMHGAGEEGEEEEEEEEEEEVGREEDGGIGGRLRRRLDAAGNVQLTRPDTMFQERYDFLSEKRRRDYKVWKAGMLRRIEGLEKDRDRRGEPMEVDS